jgi:hypothetical protein
MHWAELSASSLMTSPTCITSCRVRSGPPVTLYRMPAAAAAAGAVSQQMPTQTSNAAQHKLHRAAVRLLSSGIGQRT